VAVSNVIHLAPPLEEAISAALPLPASDINAYPPTDSGNGELFAALYQNRVKHQKRGADRIFDGHVWREPRDGELDQLAKQLARHRALAACMAPDQNHRRALTNWAIKSEHQAGKNNTLAAARATPPIADDDQPWDADHNLLGTVNGIVNLRTSELRPGKPEDKITRAVTVPFDPAISCPRWTRFLDEVFEGDNALIDFIQTAVGYSLTGFTKEQCLFIMLGRGGNGKGTFVNVLEHIMGPYVTVTGSATFETSTRSGAGGATPELAALEGARIVFAQEINERAHMDEGRIKRMTGSDTITARKLYQAEYTFTPTFKIWFAVNHPPIVRDATHGFWRRVRLVPFNRIFDPHQEPNLESTLKAEAAGILAWAVRGAAEWYRSGLISPPSVLVATKDYRDDQEILSEWMNSEIIVNPQMQTPTSEAYANYLAWAEKTKLDERERLSRSWFSRRLSQKFDHKRTNLGVIFFGFGIQGTLIM
jgi:putative DNA primase/helicase